MRKRHALGLLATVSLTAANLAAGGPSLAGGQADLIPVLTSPMSASVGVTNQGMAASAPGHLTVECNKQGQNGGCPEVPGLAAYVDPAFPGRATIPVPALAPGATFNHNLAFWGEIDWPAGTYFFELVADAGNVQAEPNEANNVSQGSLTQLPKAAVAPPAPLPFKTKTAAPEIAKARSLPGGGGVIAAKPAKPDLMATTLGSYIGGDRGPWNQVQTVRPGTITQSQLGPGKDLCMVPSKIRLMNIGDADSGPFRFSVFDDGQLRSIEFVSLEKGEHRWVDYDLPVNEGTNQVVIKLDDLKQVDEKKENNNTYKTTVRVPFDCDGKDTIKLQSKAGASEAPQRQRRIKLPATAKPAATKRRVLRHSIN